MGESNKFLFSEEHLRSLGLGDDDSVSPLDDVENPEFEDFLRELKMNDDNLDDDSMSGGEDDDDQHRHVIPVRRPWVRPPVA